MLLVTVAGRIGRDAELKDVAGTQVCNFSVAVTVREKQEEKTVWVGCALWGKRGATLAQYLGKGKQVTVTGGLGIRQYETNGEHRVELTCNVQEIALQGGGEPGQAQSAPPVNQTSQIDDREIPF